MNSSLPDINTCRIAIIGMGYVGLPLALAFANNNINYRNQDQINRFADLTGDNQWIHTDVEKAKIESPFKSTIAHGFLTLSLIPKLTENFDFESILGVFWRPGA